MKVRRLIAVLPVVLAVTAPSLLLMGRSASASAPVDGFLTTSPSPGTDLDPVTVTSSGPCSDSSATNLRTFMDGHGLDHVAVTGNAPITDYQTTSSGGYMVGLSTNFKDTADAAGTTLTGTYTLTLECRQQFGSALGTFSGTITFSDPHNYTYDGVATTTTLAASPTSPQPPGTDVTLTATLAPSGATGSVQFKDNGANIGSPVTVSGGTAVKHTTSFASGSHELTAVLTGTGGYASSSSTSVSYTITGGTPTPTATATSLAVSPASPQNVGSAVSLSAVVSPAASGAVQFLDGSSNIGPPVTVSSGSASTSTTSLGIGTHSLSAAFTPSDSASFSGSSSPATSFTITQAPPGLMTGPAISGTPAVGSTLMCVGFAFSSASSIAYAWLRGGGPIDGATSVSYVPVGADGTRQLACRVTATNEAGSTPATSTEVTVANGAPIRKAKAPAVKGVKKGTSKKGKKLTVLPGTWTIAGVTVTFQWTRDGKAIKGATKSSYTPAKKDVGHKIACLLTAALLGHDSAKASTSAVKITAR